VGQNRHKTEPHPNEGRAQCPHRAGPGFRVEFIAGDGLSGIHWKLQRRGGDTAPYLVPSTL